jgi:hypothetical protein
MTTSKKTIRFIERQLKSGQCQRGELTRKKIAKRARVSPSVVAKVACGLGMFPPGQQDRLPPDPTPEEIEERMEEIKKGWDEEEFRQRAGVESTRVELQQISRL